MEQGEAIRSAVEYALITTAKGNGRMIIASSPSSVHSWVYPLFQDGQQGREDIISFQWPSTVNPEISEEEVERLRQSRTDMEFRAEVMAEWVEGSQNLFVGLIDKAIISAQGGIIYEGEAVSLGADLALSYDEQHDASVLVVLARSQWRQDTDDNQPLPWPYVTAETSDSRQPPRYRVVDLARLTKATTEEIAAAAERFVQQYGIGRATVEQYQGKGAP